MAGILVVDDSATSRAAIKVALRALGLEINDAPSAERALSMAKLLGPSLVVSDLNLPGMSGLDLARRLRAEVEHPPPIMLVTGEDADGWRVQATEAGVAIVVSKPVSPQTLQDHARRLIEGVK